MSMHSGGSNELKNPELQEKRQSKLDETMCSMSTIRENDEEETTKSNEIDLLEQTFVINEVDNNGTPSQFESDINIQIAESSNDSGSQDAPIQEEEEVPKVTATNVECLLGIRNPEVITSSKGTATKPNAPSLRMGNLGK